MLGRLGLGRTHLNAPCYRIARRLASTNGTAADAPGKATTAASSTSQQQPFRFSGLIPERTERRTVAETSLPSSQASPMKRPMTLPSLFKDEPITPTLNKNTPSRGPFASYSGRTKTVMQGDIQGAFRQLGSVLRQNNVMREFRQQKFYEKPSDKRGRLSRERHRKRFLLGVRRLVGLVKEQRKFQ